MKEIKQLAMHMEAELKDAEEYAMLAAQYADKDRQLSDMYRNIAEQEISHADMEHTEAVRLIREWKDKGNEAPAAMQAVWDWEHEKMIGHKAEIKAMLDMVR